MAENFYGFKPQDMKIMAAMWISMKGPEPQVDWDKFAIIAGYKNKTSASVCAGRVRRRLQALREAKSLGEPLDNVTVTPKKKTGKTPTTTPRSGKKRPASGPASEDAEDDEDKKKTKLENVDPLGLDPVKLDPNADFITFALS